VNMRQVGDWQGTSTTKQTSMRWINISNTKAELSFDSAKEITAYIGGNHWDYRSNQFSWWRFLFGTV
jgi:hypothetical protein